MTTSLDLEVNMSRSELIKRSMMAIFCGIVIASSIVAGILFLLVTLAIPQTKFLR